MDLKIDAALTSFSPCVDRFVKKGYRELVSFERMVEMASKVEGLTAIALDYPTQFEDPVKLKRLLDNVGLRLGMVEIDLFSMLEWKFGSFSSMDKKIRDKAVKLTKRGMDAAIEAEAADIQLWLGRDGYDYPLEDDYQIDWQYLIDGIREVAEYRDDIKICIEYKLKEPRTHIYIGTVGKALLVALTQLA